MPAGGSAREARFGGGTGHFQWGGVRIFRGAWAIQAPRTGQLSRRAALADFTRDAEPMSKVLVVEDSVAAREAVMRLLRHEGYGVIGAANGVEALRAIEQEKPDLVLLDVMMPEMDGMSTLIELRQRPECSDLPVILVTALSDEERISQARELGVSEYLVKTRFSYEDLLNYVGRYARH